MDKLKPCPFCHRDMAVDYQFRNSHIYYGVRHADKHFETFHDRCYGGTEFEYKTEKEAIEAWNRG